MKSYELMSPAILRSLKNGLRAPDLRSDSRASGSGPNLKQVRNRIKLTLIIGTLLLGALRISGSYAAQAAEKANGVRQGERCQVEPSPSWTEQEAWVWSRICMGQVANFNETKGYGGKLDPMMLKGWEAKRVIRSSFLEDILFKISYSVAVSHQGVTIVGAWFTKPVDLSTAYLVHPLSLNYCRFESYLDMSYLRTSQPIFLDGSKFNGDLDMTGSEIRGLFMSKGQFNSLFLSGARIDLILDISAARASEIEMFVLHVDGNLLMNDHAQFEKVSLRGADIKGQLDMSSSKFAGPLDMRGIMVDGPLFMGDGAQFGTVDLRGTKIAGNLVMNHSKFGGALNMNSLTVGGSLFMRYGAEFAEVDLGTAKIGGNLEMVRSKFGGPLNMNSLTVGNSLFMSDGAEFAEVDLGAAKVGGNLEMVRSKFGAPLNMDSLRVGGSLFMRDGAEFGRADLVLAKIGGNLAMDKSKFWGPLNMESLTVDGSLIMYEAQFGEVDLRGAKVGPVLNMSGTKFGASVDLTDAKIRGELILGQASEGTTTWPAGAKLTLRNTEIGALQDLQESWPDKLELDGFTYDRLGGVDPESITAMLTRDVSWFEKWLAKQPKYSSQPYEQLASVFQRAGYKDRANAILYRSKERERTDPATAWPDRVALFLLNIFIGYGYYLWLAGLWSLIFIAIGVVVLWKSGQGRAHGMPYGIVYSLDMLLPLVRLREANYKIELNGWARYYFYFHRLMGYVLGSFLIAGLTGLVK
jgi:uncharacterized protein YjbI with pentapeptide repeats